jgi:hypothetical protein
MFTSTTHRSGRSFLPNSKSNKKGFITSKKQQYKKTTTKYKLKKPTIQGKANCVKAETDQCRGRWSLLQWGRKERPGSGQMVADPTRRRLAELQKAQEKQEGGCGSTTRWGRVKDPQRAVGSGGYPHRETKTQGPKPRTTEYKNARERNKNRRKP